MQTSIGKRTLLGVLTPSSNTVLEPLTCAMLHDLPDVSAHFGRFRVREISLREEALGQFEEEHLMDVVVQGKRYRTSAATLLASGPAWDERLGQEPRRRLDVRVGGLDLSAIVGGRGWERLGRQASLFRPEGQLLRAVPEYLARRARPAPPAEPGPGHAEA